MRRPGFTLIELVGVLSIMALLAGAASVLLTGSRHKADLDDAIDQLRSADASTRFLARSADQSVTLSFSLVDGRLVRSEGGSAVTLGYIPKDVKIGSVRSGGSTVDFGSARITINPRGASASYAVELVDHFGERHWLFFSGFTGQMLKVDDENLDALLQNSTAGIGADAR